MIPFPNLTLSLLTWALLNFLINFCGSLLKGALKSELGNIFFYFIIEEQNNSKLLRGIRSWVNKGMDICWFVLFFSYIYWGWRYFPWDINTMYLEAFICVNMWHISVHIRFSFLVWYLKFTSYLSIMHSLVIDMFLFEFKGKVLCVRADYKLNCSALEKISYSLKSTSFLVPFISFVFVFSMYSVH